MGWDKVLSKRALRVRRLRIFGSNIVYRSDLMMAVLVEAGHRHWDLRWLYLRRLQTALCLVLMASFLSQSERGFSNPEGGDVVGGSATISTPSPTTVQVDQQTQIVIIDWSSFNIASNEITQFIQPGSTALAVNRIGGNSPSAILGSLLANGRIVLINGDGIVFGPNAKIDTGSFVATTSDASNADIMSGKATFNKAGNPNAMIVNEGSINAKSGLVGLIAPAVRNDGIITAKLGSVTLGASNIFALDFTGDGLISFPLDANVVARAIDFSGKPVEALVVNNGKIEGATVMLTARAARDLVTHVISMGGAIAATSVHQDGGNVVLDGGDGGVSVSGTITATGQTGGSITVKGGDITLSGATLDASGAQGGGTIKVGDWSSSSVHVDLKSKLSASATDNGNGGNISVISANTQFAGQAYAMGGANGGNGGLVETSGHTLDIDGALINTSAVAGIAGTWLLDPDDFIINAAQAATIVANLATGNVTIQTTFAGSGGNGDIFVNSPIVWASANSLTLSAYRNIAVNANITNSAGANIILRADNSATGIGTVAFSGGMISTSGIVSIFYNPSGNNNSTINAFSYTSPTNYSGNVTGGATLNAYMLINTVFDLQNMENNLSGTYALGGDIDASATSSWNAGAGFVPIGTATGFPTPSGTPFTGMLYGQNYAISNLFINRPGTDYVGLFGYVGAGALIRDVGLINASITGGDEFVGGLVGYNQFGTIVGSYVTGAVTGSASGGTDVGYVGGLVGLNKGTITQSYADATVSGHNYVGGLVGSNHGTVLYSYALGHVSGNDSVGGLVGYNCGGCGAPGVINQTYATGLVTGVTNVGALLGFNDGGTVSQSYWDSTINAIPGLGGNSGGSFSASGLATGAFYTLSNFVGWSFGTAVNEAGCAAGTAACWILVDANGTLNNASGAPGATRPFLLSEYSTTISNSHQLQLMALNLAGSYTLGRNIDLGPALASASGMWGPAGFVPIGFAAGDPDPFTATPFTGSFDGQSHSISNLTINRPSSDYVGLFGYSTSSIKNLTLINPHVTGNFAVGSLAGFSSGMVQNVAVTGGIVSSNHYYIGGLIGWNRGTVTNASYAGTVAGGDVIGGLIGWNDSGTVSNSHATVTVTGGSYMGGLVGYNGSHTGTTTTITNSWASGTVSGSNYVGGLVGWNNMSGVISGSHSSANVTGGIEVGGLVGVNCSAVIAGCNSYPGAAGSISSSYASGTVSGLYDIGGLVGDNGGSITLSYATGAVSNTVNPDVTRSGAGGLAGYNEIGASITQSYANGNVFGVGYHIGGLAGVNAGTISDSHAIGIVTGPATVDVIGGLVGWNNGGTITNSYASGAVTGRNYVGGLVGYNAAHINAVSSISGSYASGTVNGNQYVGGLVGWNGSTDFLTATGSITNSYATGDVIGVADVGGLVGVNNPTSGVITSSHAEGNVSGGSVVGGLVGWNNNGTVTNSYAIGDVSGQNYIGGLIGYAQGGSLSGLHATGDVSGNQYVGGLIGYGLNTSVVNSYANGDVNGVTWVGGLIGWTDGSVSGSHATGDVSGTQLVGGLIGELGDAYVSGGVGSGSVTNSYATGKVSATQNYVGGLIGQSWGSVTNSWASGAVSGGDRVGGLIGVNEIFSYTANSYATGNVTGTGAAGNEWIGGLAGVNAGTITLSYATGNVYAPNSYYVGGLVGYNWCCRLGSHAEVSLSYATGNVTGFQSVGGLIGQNKSTNSNTDTIVTQSYATGIVTGAQDVGGLVGQNNNATTTQSYATGAVSASTYNPGGLVGYNAPGSVVSYSYATGNVSLIGSAQWAGGFVGWNNGSIIQSYSTGLVSGPAGQFVGGFAGNSGSGSIVLSYWDMQTSGHNNGLGTGPAMAGLIGQTTAQLTNGALPNGFDPAFWGLFTSHSYPCLLWQAACLHVITYSVADSSSTYGTLATLGAITLTGVLAGDTANVIGVTTIYDSLNSAVSLTDALNAGTYAVKVTGLTGSAAGKYIISSMGNHNGILTINPAPLIVAVNDASQLYGDANPTFSATVTGLVLGQDASVLGLSFSTLATIFSNVGNYAITLTGMTNSNYYIQSSSNGMLTINPAPLVVAVNDASRLYGDANPAFGATVTGLKLGQNDSVLGLSFSTLATIFSDVGNYAITLNGITNPNYYIQSSTNGILTINPAPLVVAVNDASRLYGDANPAFGATVTGLKLGQNDSVLGLSFSTLATIFSDVGNYAISVTGLTDHNYYIQSSTNGILTINPAPLVVAVNDASRLYGDANPAFGATVTGLKLGQNDSVLGLSFSTLATIFSDVGNYAVTLTGITNHNYYIQSSTNGTLTINPAPLVVAVNDASRLYGDANPAFSATVTGLKLGQNDSVLGLSFSTLATIFSDVGNYAITLTGITNHNYYIQSSTNGTLTINPAPLIVAVNDASRLYGDANPAFSATVTGLKLGQNDSVLGLSFSTLATIFFDVGNYAITLTGITNHNYYIQSSTNGTLTINPAPLIVAVNDASRLYGDDNPAFSATVTGLKLGQNDSVLGLSFSTLATIFSDVGTYAITVSGITNHNYYVQSSKNGTLTINPAPLTVAVNDASRLYGDANPAFSATITGFKLGQDASVLSGLVFSTLATQSSDVGAYAITSSGGTAKNYYIASRTGGTLTINPAPLVVAVNDASRLFDDNNPAFSATITGFKLGQDASVLDGLVFTTSATQLSLPGMYAIVAMGGTARNYIIVARIDGTLTIEPRIPEDAPQVMATLRCGGDAGEGQAGNNASCDFDPHFKGWTKGIDLGGLMETNNDNIACAVAGALIDCHKRVMVH